MSDSIKPKAGGKHAPWLRATVLIEASPERIWRFLDTSDVHIIRRYIPEVVNIAPVLPHGNRELMIGSRQSIKIRALGIVIDFEALISKYEHPKLYSFIFLRNGVPLGQQTTQLIVGKSGTLVTMSYERLGRFRVQWLLRDIISRHYRAALTALKLAVEGRT